MLFQLLCVLQRLKESECVLQVWRIPHNLYNKSGWPVFEFPLFSFSFVPPGHRTLPIQHNWLIVEDPGQGMQGFKVLHPKGQRGAMVGIRCLQDYSPVLSHWTASPPVPLVQVVTKMHTFHMSKNFQNNYTLGQCVGKIVQINNCCLSIRYLQEVLCAHPELSGNDKIWQSV